MYARKFKLRNSFPAEFGLAFGLRRKRERIALMISMSKAVDYT